MLLVIAAAAGGVGCDQSADAASRASRELARQRLEQSRNSAAGGQNRNSEGASEVRLFVDASRSMMGYAGCRESPTEYNTTLDRLTSDLSITTLVRFGEAQRGGGAIFDSMPVSRLVHCPEFYDRLQNPDYELFRAADTDTSGATYLYVTDGVQSDWMGSNPGPSLRLLKEWLSDGRAIAILAFRSRFLGPAWSEQRQQMLGTVSADARPFYVFVLAGSDEAIDDLLRRLSPGTRSRASVIRFTGDAVRCTAAAAGELPKYQEERNIAWALVRHRSVASASQILEYDCALRREYPLGAVLPRVTPHYRRWSGSSFSTPTDPPSGTSLRAGAVEITDAGSRVAVSGALPLDELTRFGFYEFRFDPEPGPLRVALDSLSTDSDAQIDSFERTYRFSWLLEQLARTQLLRHGWVPFSLTVQYR